MKILHLDDATLPDGIVIHGVMGYPEFRKLGGCLHKLCVFSTEGINHTAKFIKTGARNQYAKYLLFPVVLRRQFKTDAFDFERMTCGALENGEQLFVIFSVPRKLAAPPLVARSAEVPRTALSSL